MPNQLTQLHLQLNPEAKTNFCFTIQGNIGCGKSTFLQILRKRLPQAQWIEEPVSEWQNVSGKNVNLLQKYYEEPMRWGFTFQVYALYTRIKALNDALQRFPTKLKISERSILADRYVFSSLMKDLGYIDECEYQIFRSLYDKFQTMIPIERTKVIYLRCTPEKCLERTKIRQRSEQSSIPFEYLKMIHEKHESWYSSFDRKKVLVIDTTEDFKEDQEKIQQMLMQLKQFINEE